MIIVKEKLQEKLLRKEEKFASLLLKTPRHLAESQLVECHLSDTVMVTSVD